MLDNNEINSFAFLSRIDNYKNNTTISNQCITDE